MQLSYLTDIPKVCIENTVWVLPILALAAATEDVIAVMVGWEDVIALVVGREDVVVQKFRLFRHWTSLRLIAGAAEPPELMPINVLP